MMDFSWLCYIVLPECGGAESLKGRPFDWGSAAE